MEPAPSFPQLPPSSTPLALPAPSVSSSSSSKCTQLVPFAGNGMVVPSTSSEPPMPVLSVPPLAITAAMVAAADSTTGGEEVGGYNMALVPTAEGPTTLRPKCMKLKQVPGRHSLLLSDKPLAIGDSENDGCCPEYTSYILLYVRESILSLLLRLHSKLSESPDSYRPQPVPAESKSRLGNDLTFLQRLLDRIVASGAGKETALQKARERLWPQEKDVNMSPPSDRMETIQERRRRARDRQKKLIAEFAFKQKAFLQKTMETEFKEDLLGASHPAPEEKKEYECVICSQMSPSEEDRPVGLVVLLQATSVLGHCHEIPDRKLPCDDDLQHFNQGMDRNSSYASRTRFLSTNFLPVHAPMAFNIGWEGGVHVQTCGHYLHIDCHKSYIQSLTNQNQMSSRLQNLSVENGEYHCPLCRQLANSVIPLRPDLTAPVQSSEQNLSAQTQEVANLLSTPLSESDSNILKKYMGAIMEDLTNSTLPQYRSIPSPSPVNLYLFVCSIARTNLELEMVQRKFLYEPSKKSCLVPLLNVLSLHSILLMKTLNEGIESGYVVSLWKSLAEACAENWTGPCFLQNPFSTYPTTYNDQVPLLMRDPIALFIQLILALPMNMDKAIFQCVVQMTYNLAHVQSLVSLSQNLNSSLRKSLVDKVSDIDDEMGFNETNLTSVLSKLGEGRTLLGYIIKNMFSSYKAESEADLLQDVSDSYIQDHVQNYTIHFLKIAALLQSHLYKEDITLKTGDNEFQVLCSFLGLQSASSELPSVTPLNWSVDPRLVIWIWCTHFDKFLSTCDVKASESLHPHFRCHPPALLRLPHNYDAIFKHYHKKICSFCHKSPKDPSVCLVCGVMVCLREKCCREQYQYEAVKHSVVCGAGTAIYLAVNSSTIIVIRGTRACLWGSVYLDSYGEEDRDLKRGKPLYLSEDRYRLLQQQWINHSFDHTNKRWVWHKDNL